MKNILFLTDYSVSAKYIYQHAFRIGRHFNATIHFGHIFPVPAPIVINDELGKTVVHAPGVGPFLEAQYEAGREKLKNFAIRNTPSINHNLIGDVFVRGGNKAQEILNIVADERIDLIVMGMNQSNKLDNVLFGNLSLEVIEKASCPVFLVPKNAIHLGINNIVYASDYELPDVDSLNLLLEWTKAFDATLHIMHVVRPFVENNPIPYIDALLAEFQEDIDEDHLRFSIVQGDIKKELIQHVKETDADMVVLTKHDRKFWDYLLTPSITEGVIGEVDIPVLIFKRKLQKKSENN